MGYTIETALQIPWSLRSANLTSHPFLVALSPHFSISLQNCWHMANVTDATDIHWHSVPVLGSTIDKTPGFARTSSHLMLLQELPVIPYPCPSHTFVCSEGPAPTQLVLLLHMLTWTCLHLPDPFLVYN